MNRCLDCPRLILRGSLCDEHRRARQRRRNASRGGSGWEWGIIRGRILDRDGRRCQEKHGAHGGQLEVDHITPLSEGGTNDDDNLITRCQRHHRQKTRDERRSAVR